MTVRELIQETVDYYSEDINRRSYKTFEDGATGCAYRGADGKRCAFSRCCTEEVVEKVEEDLGPRDIIDLYGIEALKPQYRDIRPLEVWDEIQMLHDIKGHWNEQGLTNQGKEHVEHLIKHYAND